MKKFLIILICIVAIAAVLYFVTKGKKSSNSLTANEDPNASTLRVAIGADPDTLDHQKVSGIWDSLVDSNLYEGLTVLDSKGKVVPGVAYKWEANNTNTVFTFHLRKDAKWSDGTPINSADFVFSLQRYLDPKTAGPFSDILYVIKGAQAFHEGKGPASDIRFIAVDDYTIRAELVHPAAYFPQLTAHLMMLPVPKHLVTKYGDSWVSHTKELAFNGAYVLKEWKPKAYIKLEANPYYWDKDNVKIKHAVLYTQENADAVLKRYRSGELDIITQVGINGKEWASKKVPNELLEYPINATSYLTTNLTEKKLQDPKVRLALSLALDRQYLITHISKNDNLKPTYNIVLRPSKDYPVYKPEWADWSMEKRIAEAQKLITEAGYSKTNPLKLNFNYPSSSPTGKALGVAISAMWQKIGVQISLISKEVAVHYDDVRKGKYDIAWGGWVADYSDPSAFLFIFTKDSSMNYAFFKNDEYDKEFKLGLRSTNVKDSYAHYAKAEKLLMQSNSVLTLSHYIIYALVKPYVKGYSGNPREAHLVKFLSIQK